jgi:hypothetical protein
MRASTSPLHPVTARSISSALLILYALTLGLGLGLGATYVMLSGDPPFGALVIGPWKTWLKRGSVEADPYMRAIAAHRGDVPLATGEGLTFAATVDSEGRPLDAGCSYTVGSVTPAARLWTLTVYDQAGRLPASELGRRSFTSAEIIRDGEDHFNIAISRDLQPGNWLQPPPTGPFSLMLRLYDPPGLASLGLDESTLPAIKRVGCGS